MEALLPPTVPYKVLAAAAAAAVSLAAAVVPAVKATLLVHPSPQQAVAQAPPLSEASSTS